MIFIGMWVLNIFLNIVFFSSGKPFWVAFAMVFFGAFLFMGSLVWGFTYLAYRYVSHAKITPSGLEITRGASTSLHPWDAIGEIQTVPFVQPALWSVKFRDGSPTVAFAVEGSAWMTTGNVKAKSVFVDEIRRLASNANEVR